MNQITLSQFLLNAEKESQIDAQLRLLIETLANSCIGISSAVSQGALAGILGAHGTENIQGEVQQKLDVFANDKLIEANSWTGSTAAMASEEMDTIIPVENAAPSAPYLLLFTPSMVPQILMLMFLLELSFRYYAHLNKMQPLMRLIFYKQATSRLLPDTSFMARKPS